MTTIHGLFFQCIACFWKNLETFFNSHKTLFDILFLGAYFFQQLILFFLILLRPELSVLYVGVFALVILTTFSLEKICMESRYSRLQNLLKEGDLQQIMLYHEHIAVKEELHNIKDSMKDNL